MDINDIKGTYYDYYNIWSFNINYTEFARTATSASYSVNIVSKIIAVGNTANYRLAYQFSLNGVIQSGYIKADLSTLGYNVQKTTTFTITVPCDTRPGTMFANFVTSRPDFANNTGICDTGSKSVTNIAYNTPPYFNYMSSVTVNPDLVIIPENVTSLAVSWDAAISDQNNAVYYTVKRYKNGVYDTIVASNIKTLSVTDNIGNMGQGMSYFYDVSVSDDYNVGGSIQSNTGITNSTSVGSGTAGNGIYPTTNVIPINFSAPSNTNGNNSFTYRLSCVNYPSLPIYNPAAISSSFNLTVWRTGNSIPSGPYINYTEVGIATKAMGYVTTLNMKITCTNAYGTVVNTLFNIPVNLKSSITWGSSANVTFTNGIKISNDYQNTYAVHTGTTLAPSFCPINISWNACTDALGETVSYDVYRNIGKGDMFVANTTALKCTDNFKILTDSTIKYHVVARTSYSAADAYSSTRNIYNYRSPQVLFNTFTRTSSTFTINYKATRSKTPEIESGSNVIITNDITEIRYRINGGTWTDITVSSISDLNNITLTKSGMNSNIAYKVEFAVQDYIMKSLNMGYTSYFYTIPKYAGVLAVREQGVGIYATPDENFHFTIGTDTKINANLLATKCITIDYNKNGNYPSLHADYALYIAGGNTYMAGNLKVDTKITTPVLETTSALFLPTSRPSSAQGGALYYDLASGKVLVYDSNIGRWKDMQGTTH